MHRIISVEDLAVGMEVVALDKSWLETDFLFHRFRIKSPDEIRKLRENGIRTVTINVAEEMMQPVQGGSEASFRKTPEHDPADDTRLRSRLEAPDFQKLEIPHGHEMGEWTLLQDKTVAVIAKSFDDIRMGHAFDATLLRKQVIDTIEMTLRNPLHNSFLVTLSEVDDESYVHSANTMILALGLAMRSDLSGEELVDWGLSAVLHDVGKALIPLEILKKPGTLTPDEWETMKKHPRLGFSVLSQNHDRSVRGLCAKVCVEHHERKGGTGYPFGIEIDQVDPVSRSLMVLDIYEALTAGRVYHSPLSPAKTLTYLIENELHRLDPKAVVALVQMIGVYPVGSFVELLDGRIAMVAAYKKPEITTGPVRLLVLFSDRKTPLAEPVHIFLPSIDLKNIRQTFHPREFGLSLADLTRYLDEPGPDFPDTQE